MATNAPGQGRFEYAACQHRGKRSGQEDRYAVREFTTADGCHATLAMVADGIGGHNLGEVASEMASNAVPLHLVGQAPRADQLGRALKAAVEEANRDVYQASLKDASQSGMGTTCTAVALAENLLYLGHAGDSRLYLLRGDKFLQLSIDHTWGEEAIQAGRPVEVIRQHPNRGVLKRYLGIDPVVEVDTRCRMGEGGPIVDSLSAPLRLAPGDTLLLCSDGLADGVPEAELRRALQAHDLDKAAKDLVACALRDGTGDNITAVVLRCAGGVAVPARTGSRLWIAVLGGAVLGLAILAAAIYLLPDLLARARSTAASPAPAALAPAVQTASPAVAEASRPRATLPGGEGRLVVATAAALGASETPATQSPGSVIEPTLMPTYTSQPTPTPIPTRPPSPTSVPKAAVATPAATTPWVRPAEDVDLLSPLAGETIQSEAVFRWQPRPGFSLGRNQLYELVFWGTSEDAQAGLSPTGASTLTSVTVPLERIDARSDALGSLVEPGGIFWAVFLFDPSAGAGRERGRQISEKRLFIYVRTSEPATATPEPPTDTPEPPTVTPTIGPEVDPKP